MDFVTVTRPQLAAAMLQWTQDARAQRFRLIAETDALSAGQVAEECAEQLWRLLNQGHAA